MTNQRSINQSIGQPIFKLATVYQNDITLPFYTYDTKTAITTEAQPGRNHSISICIAALGSTANQRFHTLAHPVQE